MVLQIKLSVWSINATVKFLFGQFLKAPNIVQDWLEVRQRGSFMSRSLLTGIKYLSRVYDQFCFRCGELVFEAVFTSPTMFVYFGTCQRLKLCVFASVKSL